MSGSSADLPSNKQRLETLSSTSHTTVVQEATSRPTHLDVFLATIQNLPQELRTFGQIPCAQMSLYNGMLVGGIVAGISLMATANLASLRYGFYAYLGTSLLTWGYCRHSLRSARQTYFHLPQARMSRDDDKHDEPSAS